MIKYEGAAAVTCSKQGEDAVIGHYWRLQALQNGHTGTQASPWCEEAS